MFVSLVLGLFLLAPHVAQSVKEAGAQVAATGANVDARVQNNGFSTQAFRTVPTDAVGPQSGTMAGVPGKNVQGQEKRDANSQSPKPPTGLKIIRAN